MNSTADSQISSSALRAMNDADVGDVASLHLDAFPNFFLSRLGPRALRELYSGMLADPTGIAIVAQKDQRIVGFTAGTTDSRSFYRRLFLQRWRRFARAIALLTVVGTLPEIQPGESVRR